MRKYADFNDFLTDRGRGVYNLLKQHFSEVGTWKESYAFELSMLANSLDLYYKYAQHCNEEGITQTFESGASQVSPEYTAMKTEYQNILKHSPKFGLNPADLSRLFKEKPQNQPTTKFETGPMKLAK